MTIAPVATSTAWEGEEAPSGRNDDMPPYYVSITVPRQELERELLERLRQRSRDPYGLDWNALLGLDDAWGTTG
jgi:hypothetical protein